MTIQLLERVEKCYICGSGQSKLLMPVRDCWYGLPGEFNIVQCTDCGLIYLNPRPKPEAISFYYPKTYAPHQHAGYEGSRNGKIKAIIKSLFDIRSHYLPPPGSPDARLLEIGCSYGGFLDQARAKGWEVYGVEIADEPVKYGREFLGLNIHHGILESARFPDDFFDLATGWMVLEHLPDPLETLQEVGRITKAGGQVAFSVPNIGSWEFRLFGPNWFALEVPRHFSHFTSSSIGQLFTRSGLKLEKIYYQKNISNIPASMALTIEKQYGQNMLTKSLRNIYHLNVFNKLSFPIAAMMSWFKMTGRITVIGRVIK
ncbi:Methyltransferase domain-containing protein [Desulfotomaculum arcticum]|uniref:Methyltransferase domain-containing protein n=1 Tax=Desulfotruncus arcticus DSM 17038 TaxID=1121424 RepID=A0A1I2VRN7_9FIRM|nr:class I SAM-dependent methyltransferase [Desulfotruncus arcticus]SFG89841.1 Methyltransferase domain-containing protein [Desulfotomaculum arcticum] [Desulfotruncus arcticus DSM 17038]